MDFKDRFPDYVSIEEHIRRARLERSIAMAEMIVDAFSAIGRGARKLGEWLSRKAAPRTVWDPVARDLQRARWG